MPYLGWPNRRLGPGQPAEVHETSEFRWKPERGHGCLDNRQRLVTWYDWPPPKSYVAFRTIPCFMVALSRILD
jgi:hypothetical protein